VAIVRHTGIRYDAATFSVPMPSLGREALKTVARSPVALTCLALAACGAEPVRAPAAAPPTAPQVNEAAEPEVLPAEQVLFSLRGREATARQCFDDGQSRGAVRVAFRVQADGQVRSPAVEESTLNQPEVERCLTDFVTLLHFDPQSNPRSASWTFVHGLGDPQILVQANKRAKARLKRGKAKGFDKPQGARARGRYNGARIDNKSGGQLEPRAIDNVAEAGFRLYGHCLRDGLVRNTYLSGRVLLHFAITEDGHVTDVRDAGSDLPDLDAIDCIAQGFYALQFPAPSGGSVGVTYPLILNEE
jgi:hypothetical protein